MRSSISLLVLAPVLLAGACAKEPAALPPEAAAEGSAAESPAGEPGLPQTVRLSAAAIAEAGIAIWRVQPVDLEHLLPLNGSVGYDENRLLDVAANVPGRVARILVDLGQRVDRGAPLVEIESVELGRAREEYLTELAAWNASTRAYERAKKLVEARAISVGEFQTREADYLAKKAALEAAERALHLYGESDGDVARLRASAEPDQSDADLIGAPRIVLRAPFAGRVIERQVTPGAQVEAMKPLLTLTDLSTVWVFLQVYEKDLALLREGLPVTLRTEAYPQESFHGRLDFLGSVVDPSTRTVRVRATVANQSEKLRPGMFVKAQVEVPKPQSELHVILAVPQSALQTLEGRTCVFTEIEPGVFERRLVETGHTFEGFPELLAGVRAGDAIATEGSFVLKSEFARATLVEED